MDRRRYLLSGRWLWGHRHRTWGAIAPFAVLVGRAAVTDGDDRVPRLSKETIQMQLAGLRRQGFRELVIPGLAGVVSEWRLVSLRERMARVDGLVLSSDQRVVVFRAPVADGSWPALVPDGWLARRTDLLSAVQLLLGPVEGQS